MWSWYLFSGNWSVTPPETPSQSSGVFSVSNFVELFSGDNAVIAIVILVGLVVLSIISVRVVYKWTNQMKS